MLKKTMGNFSRQSTSYRPQSKFKGSDRQLRGRIIKLLTNHKSVTANNFEESPPEQLEKVIKQLIKEKLISKKNGKLTIFEG